MLRLYRDTAVLAFQRAAKAWPLALSLLVYAAILMAAGVVASGLGIVGGFLLGLVAAACVSAYLSLLSQAVHGQPVSLRDLQSGFGTLFWDVVSVMFALWIIDLAVTILARGAGENGLAIAAMAGLAMAFFFNPVPEMIYQGQSRSFELLMASSRFMLANPLIWFLPNVAFGAILLLPSGWLRVQQPGELLLIFGDLFSASGLVRVFTSSPLWALPLLLLLLHYVMVFRGVLFQALTTTSARRRQWEASTRR